MERRLFKHGNEYCLIIASGEAYMLTIEQAREHSCGSLSCIAFWVIAEIKANMS